MKFRFDHDLHIHTFLSSCSKDSEQTPERILRYAEENGLQTVCVTDHVWNGPLHYPARFYEPQDLAHIRQNLPLPQAAGVRFLFGAETDMDRDFRLGLSPEDMETLDFVIIPTTHMHMPLAIDQQSGVEERADAYVRRLRALTEMDLPAGKIGIAHLTTALIAGKQGKGAQIPILALVSDDTFRSLFSAAAKKGYGIELNQEITAYAPEAQEPLLRPFRIAKSCGCKFYLGSDAHNPSRLLSAPADFAFFIDALGLEDTDRFTPGN